MGEFSRPTQERLLVCVGPNPSSANVIRATKKMASRMNAEWFAVYVKTPRMVQLPEADQNRAVENLQLAENLGAQTFTLFSRSMGEKIGNFARQNKITKIMVGKPKHYRWEPMAAAFGRPTVPVEEHYSALPSPWRRAGLSWTNLSRICRKSRAMNPIILLIEDDPHIRRFLRASLVTQGYDLMEAGTGREGLALAASRVPDVVLLDLGLPDMEGIDVIQQLRAWSNIPIIILSARGQERDKVSNLDAGADDYLTKPFGVGELLARMRVALRKSMPAEEGKQEVRYFLGNIEVDFERRLVFRGQEEIHLTPIEYKLLAALLKHRGKVVTHRQLLKEVWGPSYVEQNPYLRIFILNLRRKLEDDPTRPQYLLTEPGVGYRLRDD